MNLAKVLIGVTGNKEAHWKEKLREIDSFDITEAALFLECFELGQRKRIYEALLSSDIKKIPLVHIRNDMDKGELVFLAKNFSTKYFTIHEDSFEVLSGWDGFYKNLFLEMNADNFIPGCVNIDKIGGFCIDLSHFMVAKGRNSAEYDYIVKRKKMPYFACNHLNGYSPERNVDMHTINDISDFDYLKALPKFLFGKVIALETDNSIAEQLRFREYLAGLLKEKV